MIKKSMTIVAVLSLSVAACAKQDPAIFNSYGVEKGAGSTGIHIVSQGDTVYTIAKNYQLPMREIITLNKIQPPYNLNTGYRLKLPPPNEYQVREGDTIESVARLYEVSPNRLVTLNNLQNSFQLRGGQVIRLPSKTASSVIQYNSNIVPPPRIVNLPNNSVNASVPSVPSVQNARLEPVTRSGLDRPVGQPWSTSKPAEPAPVRDTTVASVEKAPVPAEKPTLSSSYKPSSTSIGKFMRPIDGEVISTYGPKKNGLHNDGVNIKAVRGTPVRAAENGVVVYNGDDLDGYGNLVLIRHENKLMTAYAHLDKTLIERGAKVVRGQSIGTVGKTGQVDTPQLHFEIRKGSTPLNPDKYL